MGCWNHTCFLTNLAVHAGEDIATMILLQTRENYSSLEASCNWHPAPVMYYGEYDDYGGCENSHGSQNDYILEEFRKAIPLDQVDTKYIDNFDTIDKLSRTGDAGGLRLSNNDSGNVPIDVRLVVIKQSVLDRFLEQYYFTDYNLKTKDGEEVRITYKYLCGTIPLYIAKLKDFQKEEYTWESLPDVGWNDSDILGRHLHYFMKDVTPQFFQKTFIAKIKKYAAMDEDEALTEVLEEFIKYTMIQMYMSASRRVFIRPMCSSQETDPAAQKLTAEITLDVIEQQRIEWEKEDFPEDAWDPKHELFMEQHELTF